jgi:F0F1-type ATP synthase membrane subunit b/b'
VSGMILTWSLLNAELIYGYRIFWYRIMASVEKIITALSELEKDIERLSNKVQDMKKRIMANSDKEISLLREKIIEIAKTESEKIISAAKLEAEEKSQKILEEAETNLTKLRENTKLSFDKSVKLVVDSVLNKRDTNETK